MGFSSRAGFYTLEWVDVLLLCQILIGILLREKVCFGIFARLKFTGGL